MSANIKNNTLNILIAIFILTFQLVVLKSYVYISDFIAASFMILITTLAIIFFGFKRYRKDTYNREIIKKTLIIVLLYFIFSYGLGIYTNFNRNGYSLKPVMIIRNVICPLFIIIFMELYRYVIVNSTSDKRRITFSITMLILFEIFISMKFSSLTSYLQIFRLSTTVAIPIIVKNIVLTIICKNSSFVPGMIYRIPIELYLFLIPLIPEFSDYLTSMLGVSVPLILYMAVYTEIREKNNPEFNNSDSSMMKGNLTIYEYVGVAFLIVVITLVSGFFPYTIIAVGSDSMAPKYEYGDAVIFKRVHKVKDLKVNDVIVYRSKEYNKYIVHRLVKIKKDKDGNYNFITKGDNNNSEDKIYLDLKDIKGKVKMKIKYIGYPTLVFSKIIEK